MTDKEFKKLNRSELISIIYEYQKTQEALEKELAEVKAKLADRDLKINNAGSIAEAVVSLNDLFETAQKTADEYLEILGKTARESEAKAKALLADAEKRASDIIADAMKRA